MKTEKRREKYREYVSATYHVMSLTHYVDGVGVGGCGGDDETRDVRSSDDALNVRLVLMSLNRLNRSLLFGMIHVHSYHLHSKIHHFAPLSIRILRVTVMQLY